MADKPLASQISEDQLIGMCLTDPESTVFQACEAGIDKDWFFQSEAEHAFRVVLDMYVNQREISLPTVIERAQEMKVKLPLEYAQRCIDACPVYNMPSVIDKMREMFLRRAMVEQGKWIKNYASIMEEMPEESIGKAICTLADYTATHQSMTKEQIRAAIVGRYKAAATGGTSGIPTPWPKINKTLGGLVPSQVAVFAGRGGIGKSQASATLVHHLGSTGIPVGYLPFEDGVERTWARLAGIEGKYSTFRMDTGASEAECSVAEQYIEQVMKYPIHMEDRPMSADQVMAWAIHQKVKNKIQLLVIDAFKDLRRKTRDVAEDDSMSQTITQIARRLNIPVWISHHVRKFDSSKNTEKLTQDDIRGSANIVNDARVLIVCQNWKDEHDAMHFSFDVVKNNNGPCPVSIPMERVSNHNYWRELPEIKDEN
jgi:replicative DNA helicase